MTARTTSQANLGCLVSNVALGKDGRDYQRKIEQYMAKNGPEWTCNRIKAVRQVALLLKSGESDKALSVLRDNSISYHKGTLIPKGIEGVVVRRYVEAQRASVIKRIDAALRYYTSITLDDLSPKQAKKALTAICSPSTSSVPTSQMRQEGSGFTRTTLNERGIQVKSLEEFPITADERHAEHLRATSKYYSRYSVPGVKSLFDGRSMKDLPYSSMAMSFMTEPWLPDIINSMVPCQQMRDYIMESSWYDENPQLFVGKITPIQEQGCKARVVFQPSAWIQLGFMPLHRRIADIAERLFPRESCVRDQVKGAYALFDHLQAGNSAYCTDLSSATDRFPRAFSLGVLDALGYGRYAIALEEICQKPVECSFAPTGEVKYSVGQPMGIYGSFPLFHLSNMLVADGAVRLAQRNPIGKSFKLTPFGDGSYFKTVGDDIIFSDPRVAKSYRHLMERYGVDISESKSFEGNLAEFAGFIAVKTSRGQAVYRPYKVPDGDSVTNPIQFLDSLGASLEKRTPKRVRKYWSKQYRTYRQTVGSRDLALEPIVPGEEHHFQDANRGDNRTLVNLCVAIAAASRKPLPDLSGSTKINKVPLFRERGPFDFYGYNPDNFIKDDLLKVHPARRTQVALNSDPLMTGIRTSEFSRIIRERRKTFQISSEMAEQPEPNTVGLDDQCVMAEDSSEPGREKLVLQHLGNPDYGNGLSGIPNPDPPPTPDNDRSTCVSDSDISQMGEDLEVGLASLVEPNDQVIL